jgi:hypothetical protein
MAFQEKILSLCLLLMSLPAHAEEASGQSLVSDLALQINYIPFGSSSYRDSCGSGSGFFTYYPFRMRATNNSGAHAFLSLAPSVDERQNVNWFMDGSSYGYVANQTLLGQRYVAKGASFDSNSIYTTLRLAAQTVTPGLNCQIFGQPADLCYAWSITFRAKVGVTFVEEPDGDTGFDSSNFIKYPGGASPSWDDKGLIFRHGYVEQPFASESGVHAEMIPDYSGCGGD